MYKRQAQYYKHKYIFKFVFEVSPACSAVFRDVYKRQVKNSRVVHTVIKSDRRFTYEEAQEIIETGKGDFQEEVLSLIHI